MIAIWNLGCGSLGGVSLTWAILVTTSGVDWMTLCAD